MCLTFLHIFNSPIRYYRCNRTLYLYYILPWGTYHIFYLYLICYIIYRFLIFLFQTYSMIMDRKGQAFKMELNRSAFDVIVASYFFLFSASDHLILSSLGVVAFLSSLLWLASLRDDFRTFEMSKKKIIDEKVDNLAGTGSL